MPVGVDRQESLWYYNIIMMKTKLTCLRCGHKWTPERRTKGLFPALCQKCHSPLWNKQRHSEIPELNFRCKRCGHKWIARLLTPPKSCPNIKCHTSAWDKEKMPLTCKKCGHKWFSLKANPSRCPNCHSHYWNTDDLPKSHKGEDNPRWNNGISEYPNHYLLKKNRLKVLKRDNYTCQLCGKYTNQVHHIDKTKTNHKKNNLRAICRKCNLGIYHAGPRGKYKKYPDFTPAQAAKLVGCSIYTVIRQLNGRRSVSFGDKIDQTIKKLKSENKNNDVP
jgi:predicted Zn-ribbon and HTH transcriptional regulator